MMKSTQLSKKSMQLPLSMFFEIFVLKMHSYSIIIYIIYVILDLSITSFTSESLYAIRLYKKNPIETFFKMEEEQDFILNVNIT